MIGKNDLVKFGNAFLDILFPPGETRRLINEQERARRMHEEIEAKNDKERSTKRLRIVIIPGKARARARPKGG
jgi:hypothetical protein